MRVTEPRPNEPIRLVWTRLGPDGKPTKISQPRYRVVIDAGRHPATGKRRQICSTHRTLAAARAYVAKVTTDKIEGRFIAPDRTTFEKFAAGWLDRLAARGDKAPRKITLTSYRSTLKHANAAYGAKPIGKVTRDDVEAVTARLVRAGRSERTLHLHLFVVRAVFNDAIERELILRNPAAAVKAAGAASKPRSALTPADLAKLRAHLIADRLFALWLLTLCGLRRSEILGLRWSDIDFGEGTLTIARAVVADSSGKRSEPTPPKTRRGNRVLPLPADMIAALRELRESHAAEFGFEHVRTGWVAVDEAGRPYRPEVWSQMWAEHCAAAGVAPVVLHAARHSSVTAMRDAGIADHVVAAWHGHDEAVMRTTYSHAHREQMAAAGQALSAVLNAATASGMLGEM